MYSFDPPRCFALCSVSGQRVVLRIPIEIELRSSMTNNLMCALIFVSVPYKFFKLIVICRLWLSMWRKIMIPMVQRSWVYTDDIYLDV